MTDNQLEIIRNRARLSYTENKLTEPGLVQASIDLLSLHRAHLLSVLQVQNEREADRKIRNTVMVIALSVFAIVMAAGAYFLSIGCGG